MLLVLKVGEGDPESKNAGVFWKLEKVKKHILLYSLQDRGQTWIFASPQFLCQTSAYRLIK